MNVYGKITGSLTAPKILMGALSSAGTLDGSLSIPASASQPYDGEYEFTPTINTQVIEIEHLEARQNITINPIPQNYGLITYNGTTIRVS